MMNSVVGGFCLGTGIFGLMIPGIALVDVLVILIGAWNVSIGIHLWSER